MAATQMASPTSAPSRSPSRGATCSYDRTTGMDEVYGNFNSCLSQWRKEFSHSVGSEMQRSLRDLCRERAQLDDLRADVVGSRSLVEAASKLHVEGKQLADTVRGTADAANERSRALSRARDEFLQQRDSNLEALLKERQEIEAEKAVMEERYIEAEKLLCAYRERLGLAITREAAHTVRMSFSLLDKANPERLFTFTLGLGEHNGGASYAVCECNPMIPELQSLLAQLNSQVEAHTALPRFVCSMRRAFVQLLAPTQQKL